jgi:uncharacterized protein (DUF2141 family)
VGVRLAFLLTGAVLSLTGFVRGASAADLIVDIDDIRNDDGVVVVSLYDSAKTWLVDGGSIADHYPQAHVGRVETVFRDLRPGTYAVVVMHDENHNNKMDYTFFGLPKKGYAFSRNVRPFLSGPSFSRAAITLTPQSGVIEIKMVYP